MKDLISDYCSYFNMDIEEVSKRLKSDYFRNFKDYDSICENSFTFDMIKKYRNDIVEHYNDILYVEACMFFYKINCKYVFRYIKLIKLQNDNKFVNSLLDVQRNIIRNSKKIVDLGAGIGAFTIDIKNIFADSDIFYVNLKSKQSEFAESMFKKYGLNVNVCNNYDDISNVDIVFSLDYFEHFENFKEEISKVVNKLNPNIIVDTSDFSHVFIGHYQNYKIDSKFYNFKKCTSMFRNMLNDLGYSLHNISKLFWNDKPKIYFKKDLI